MELSILNLLLVLLAAWLSGQLFNKMGYPSVLGELMAGIILGPPLLGLLQGSEALAILAEVGVLLMMLYIGMEIDPKELRKASLGGFLAAIGGFVVPFFLGYWVVTYFGGTGIAGVFVGMAMGVTSLATKSRILVDLKILDTRIAHVMMAGALIADTISLIIFAGIISFAAAGSLDIVGILIIAGEVLLYFAVAWFLGLKVFPPFYKWLKKKELTGRTFNITLVLLIALLFAELAHVAGLHGILGAFIAGLFLREAIAERKLSHELTGLVKDVSLGFLAPIFFVTAGFQVSFEVFQTDLVLLISVILLATVGKIIGTALFYAPSRNGWREGITIGAGMNGRGAVEIVIAGIGLQAGIIDQQIFSILVFMAIITTATVPIFLKWGVEWLNKRNELVRSTIGKEGYLFVGAGPVARIAAKIIAERHKVRMIDTNESNCKSAKELGINAFNGDAIEDVDLKDAGIEDAGNVISFTLNPEVNVLVTKKVQEDYLIPNLNVLMLSNNKGLTKQIEKMNANILFGKPVDLYNWNQRVINNEFEIEEIELQNNHPNFDDNTLPLVVKGKKSNFVFTNNYQPKNGDKIVIMKIKE